MEAEAGSSFQPKEDIINTLATLGFSRNAAIKGCYYTGNYSADLAAAWILENQDKNLDGPLEEDLDFEGEEEEEEFPEGIDLHKMVFVVNMELNMGVGKVAAQCAHAAVALHRTMMEAPDRFGTMLMSWEQFGLKAKHKMVLFIENMELNMCVGNVANQCTHAAVALHRTMMEAPDRFGAMLMSWEQFGETKIVLKGDNAAQLQELAKKAENQGLPNYLVQDAGRTQIAAGSQTVLGILGKLDVVDSITGKLKLL